MIEYVELADYSLMLAGILTVLFTGNWWWGAVIFILGAAVHFMI